MHVLLSKSTNKILRITSYPRIELIAVVLTGILKYLLMDWLQMRAIYIAGICIFWGAYILYRYSTNREVLKHWGFTRGNLKPSLAILLPLVVLSILASLIYAYFNGSLLFTWHILPIICLYPIWGIIQQYLMLGLITNNLISLLKTSVNRYVLVLLISILFGLVHYTSYFLMLFTFALEAVFMLVYFKWRNLWAIGIAHGLIASFLLHFVLMRNLWSELFAWF